MHKKVEKVESFEIEKSGEKVVKTKVHVYTCSTFGFRRWITKEVESNSGKLKLLGHIKDQVFIKRDIRYHQLVLVLLVVFSYFYNDSDGSGTFQIRVFSFPKFRHYLIPISLLNGRWFLQTNRKTKCKIRRHPTQRPAVITHCKSSCQKKITSTNGGNA